MAIKLTESRLRKIIREELEELASTGMMETELEEWSEWDDDDKQTPEYGTGDSNNPGWRRSPKQDYDRFAHDTDSKSGYSRPGYSHDDSDRYKSGYGS